MKPRFSGILPAQHTQVKLVPKKKNQARSKYGSDCRGHAKEMLNDEIRMTRISLSANKSLEHSEFPSSLNIQHSSFLIAIEASRQRELPLFW
jgi:hypothetical protein